MPVSRFNEMLAAAMRSDARIEIPPYRPLCASCGDYGYTGCPEARLENGVGDFLAIALSKGVACSCAAGRRFAEAQVRWFEEREGEGEE